MYLKRIRKNQSYLRNIYIFFLWNCLPKMQQKPTVELKVVRECNKKKKQKEKKSNKKLRQITQDWDSVVFLCVWMLSAEDESYFQWNQGFAVGFWFLTSLPKKGHQLLASPSSHEIIHFFHNCLLDNIYNRNAKDP